MTSNEPTTPAQDAQAEINKALRTLLLVDAPLNSENQRLLDSLPPRQVSPNTISSTPRRPLRGGGREEQERRRMDLSRDYMKGRGKKPSDLLDEEIDAIIEEHESGGDKCVCVHRSDAAAPFLSIFQSTGYGKTRAMLELAKKQSFERKKKVVYLLCKSLDQSWEAPQVLKEIMHEMEDDGEHKEETYERKWGKFLDVVQRLVEAKTPENLYNAQITERMELGNFYNDLLDAWRKEKTPKKLKELRTAMKVGQTDQVDQSNQSNESKERQVTFVSYSGAEPIRKGCLVLCFDEVSAFNKPAFRALRRAAKTLGIVCVFADTAASICKSMDPNYHSSKEKGGLLGRFVAPIFALNTGDLGWNRHTQDDDYATLFCAGRPRWLSHYETCKQKGETPEECIESLILLAQGLLLRIRGETLKGEDNKSYGNTKRQTPPLPTHASPGWIAAFTSRFSLGAESQISDLLVKHSVATVVGISEDREIVSCAYPSEPVLAEASARFTKDENELKMVLRHVKAAIHGSQKLLDPPKGDSGEMCAAALLGYSMDLIRTRNDHNFMSEPVPLSDFLSSVYESDVFTGESEIAAAVNDWNVNFTHFDRPNRKPAQSDLKIMWKRRLAYYVPEGAEGLDLLIAIRNDGADLYGTIRVQVKNYRNEISKSERNNWLYALLPSHCPPYFDDQFSVSLLLSTNGIQKCCRLCTSAGGLIYDTAEPETKKVMTRTARKEETDKRRVLQLATCFPGGTGSIGWISEELRDICSLETSKQVSKDYFCQAYTGEIMDEEKERMKECGTLTNLQDENKDMNNACLKVLQYGLTG